MKIKNCVGFIIFQNAGDVKSVGLTVDARKNRQSQIRSYTKTYNAVQRNNTENLKQVFPAKELRGLSPNFHIHVYVSDLNIPTIDLLILLQENMWTDPGNI